MVIIHYKQKIIYKHVNYSELFPREWKKNSLRSSKSVDKKEVLTTAAIYFSGDKVGIVYLVQNIFENSTVNISALSDSYENMAN
jgi:hypothetical protein